MTPTPIRWLAAAAASGALVAAVILIPGRSGFGQDPATKGDRPKGRQMFTTAQCIGCHGGPNTDAYRDYQMDMRTRPTEFVRLTEHGTWRDEDLHSQAFRNIVPAEKAGPEGQPNLAWRMQQVLAGTPGRDKNYRVDEAAECLTCHAVDRRPGPAPTGPVPGRFYTATGVGCESCHGFAEDWFGPHTQADTWRVTDPKDKEKLGLVDLRDPYTRAMKCASCHVGNKAEGKFVTHEMYAAGHPPLPAFESVTYAHDQPRHYFTHRENKILAEMKPEAAWKNFHFRQPADAGNPGGECPDARSFAVGTIAAFEATMKLLADDAKDTRPGDLLDFAHFDCYACHHDLKHASFRQQRGYRGVPGRPTMRPWATETLQAVLKHAEGADGPDTGKVTAAAKQIRDGLVALNKKFDARPFGQPGEIADQAGKLVEQCQLVRPELGQLIYSPERTEALYRLLADRVRNLPANGKPGPDGLYLDHDAAQQAVWGLQALQAELRHAGRLVADEDALKGPAGELDKVTRLRLREAKREPVAGPRLEQRLKGIAQFEPGVFLPKAQAWLNAFEKK